MPVLGRRQPELDFELAVSLITFCWNVVGVFELTSLFGGGILRGTTGFFTKYSLKQTLAFAASSLLSPLAASSLLSAPRSSCIRASSLLSRLYGSTISLVDLGSVLIIFTIFSLQHTNPLLLGKGDLRGLLGHRGAIGPRKHNAYFCARMAVRMAS